MRTTMFGLALLGAAVSAPVLAQTSPAAPDRNPPAAAMQDSTRPGSRDMTPADRAGAAVTQDSTVTLQGRPVGYNQSADPNSIFNSLLAMGAGTYYRAGITGKGVDVAIIDSGVTGTWIRGEQVFEQR